LQLNQKAALDEYRSGVRIVKDGNQVPYFAGDFYSRTIDINLNEKYDRNKNHTEFTLQLPVASRYWKSIEFRVPGVFNRKPVLQLRKPGNLGWKKWKDLNWTGSGAALSSFIVDVSDLPKGETELLLDIWHGDNSPISISQVLAHYQTQDLFFNAATPGEYLVYGGNSSAKAPNYDISLIRNSMLKAEPQKIQMGEAAPHSETAIARQIEDAFSEKGIGLYLVLGLVTLVLIVLIVKMFPEEAAPESDQNKTDKES
ncbi:MAG: hypothetical protein ACOYXC_06540, partial [Candidatus Rifleibacteriota bacterium]